LSSDHQRLGIFPFPNLSLRDEKDEKVYVSALLAEIENIGIFSFFALLYVHQPFIEDNLKPIFIIP